MAKQAKKSMADLIGSKNKKRPSLDEIENITKKIHQPTSTKKRVVVAKKEGEAPKAPKVPTKKKEKIKRISVNASVSLYLKAKTKATMEEKTLMAYIIGLMEKDLL